MTSGAAISDVVARQAQPQARAAIQSMRACGVIFGSLLGGWLQSKLGPAATYLVGFSSGAIASINIVCRVPETRKPEMPTTTEAAEIRDSRIQGAVGSVDKPSMTNGIARALCVIFSDSELRPLAAILTLLELTHLPQFSDVATLLFRDRLQWSPVAIGRFVAAYGIAQFVGNQATGYLVQRFGPDRQASLSHLGITLSFLLWSAARSTSTMTALLVPLTLSFGRASVIQSKAISRAKELGLNNGEAAGALSTLGSFAKILGPQIFVTLYNWYSRRQLGASTVSRRRVSLASPMLFVAVLGIISEMLHRWALIARSKNSCRSI